MSYFEYDDVLIQPTRSNVNSRTEVDISVDVCGKFSLKFPVMASPMCGIVDAEFCKLFSDLGGLGILHRFYKDKTDWNKEVEIISKAEIFGLSVGLGDLTYRELLEKNPNVLLVDVANGYTDSLLKFCNTIKTFIEKNGYATLLMSGNVCTYEGCQNLYNSGVDIVRVGIGGGGLCSTRNVTGVGVPQLSAVADCSASDALIVSDGGIKNSGDAAKSFVAGADVIMIGSLLGQTFESVSDGKIRGMASKSFQEEMGYTEIKSVEGIERPVEKIIGLADFIDNFSWGIRSAGTYIGAKNLREFQRANFVTVGTGSIKRL